MYADLGIVKPGTTLYLPFHTFDSNDPSASVTLTGLATTDIEIYKDGSTTQRASDAGYSLLDTDGIDFDGTTGIHGVSIDLADNTTAEFYQSGHKYWVVVASITVDAGTINFILGTFTIGYPDAALNTHIDTLASQTSFTLPSGRGSGDNDAYNNWKAIIHDVASAVQIAVGYVSDYVGSTRTITLAADPGIFTMAAGDNIHLYPPDNVAAWNGAAPNALQSGRVDAYGGALAANVITATSIATDAITAAKIAANAITSSEIADGAITAAKLATDAITADKIAADAIGSSELATTAVDEIVDGVWDELISGAAHNTNNSAGKRLRQASELGTYSNSTIYIDTVNGTAGTTDFENGTDTNPVDTLADAITLGTSLGISRFHVASGSSVTFGAESHASETWIGDNWTLAFGTITNAAGIYIRGANVSGVMAGTGTTQHIVDCIVGATSVIAGTHVEGCSISGTQTIIEAGDVFFDRCHSGVAGSGAPQFDVGSAIGNTSLNIRHYSGGVDLRNLGQTGTDTCSLEGNGQLIVNANCTGGTISLRGNWQLSDSGSATITTDDDTTDINAILVDTAEIGAAGAGLTEAGGDGDHLTAINLPNQTMDITGNLSGSVGSVTGAVGSVTGAVGSVTAQVSADVTAISGDSSAADSLEASMETLVVGTATGGTTSTVTSAVTGHGDDTFNGRVMIFRTGTLQYEAGVITDYDSTAGTFTFAASTWTTSPTTETFVIV